MLRSPLRVVTGTLDKKKGILTNGRHEHVKFDYTLYITPTTTI